MKKIILCLILCSCIIHFFSCVASKTLQKDTIDNDIKNKAEKKLRYYLKFVMSCNWLLQSNFMILIKNEQ